MLLYYVIFDIKLWFISEKSEFLALMEVFALKLENCAVSILLCVASPEFVCPIVVLSKGRMVSHVLDHLLVGLLPRHGFLPVDLLVVDAQCHDERCSNFETGILLFLNLFLNIRFKASQRADWCFRIKSELTHCHWHEVLMASSVQDLELGKVSHLAFIITSEVVLQNDYECVWVCKIDFLFALCLNRHFRVRIIPDYNQLIRFEWFISVWKES